MLVHWADVIYELLELLVLIYIPVDSGDRLLNMLLIGEELERLVDDEDADDDNVAKFGELVEEVEDTDDDDDDIVIVVTCFCQCEMRKWNDLNLKTYNLDDCRYCIERS